MEVISPVTLSSPITASSISDDNHDRLLSRRHHHHHHHHVGDGNGGIVISAKIGMSSFEASHRQYHLRQLDIGRQDLRPWWCAGRGTATTPVRG